MEKTILVRYQPFGADQAQSIPVCYETETDGDVITLRCRVDMPFGEVPWWLKPHKFELRASYEGNTYQLLMNDTRNVYSVDAALFMDKVQEEILQVEKRKGTRIENA
jgi:hypothetical protein